MHNPQLTKSNDIKRNRILFDFDSIVDLKLSYVYQYLIEHNLDYSDETLKLLKKIRMTMVDNVFFYAGLEESDDIDILHPEYPIYTSMKTLLNEYLNHVNGLIKPVVLCQDAFQKDIITKTFPGVKTLLGTRDKVNTIKFSRIVVGNAKDIIEFRDPVTVDFMILNFRENFNKDNPKLLNPEVLIAVGPVNAVTIALAYPEIEKEN